MDYDKQKTEELVRILDEVTKQRQQGKLSPSTYQSIVYEIGKVLLKRGQGAKQKVIDDYNRAMRGL